MTEEIFDVGLFTSSRFDTMLEKSSTNAVMNLTHLNVTDAHVGRIIERLKVTSVEKIWLSFNALTDAGVNALMGAMLQLRTFDTLRELCLAGNRLSDTSVYFIVQALSRGSRLRVLDLANNRGITDDAVALLASFLRNSYLEKLLLNGCAISDRGAIQLIDCVRMTRLREIRLASPQLTELTVVGAAAIVRSTCLQNVVVGGTNAVNAPSQRLLKENLAWKNADEVRVLTALAAVHTLPRMNAKSTFRHFLSKNLSALAKMLCSTEQSTIPSTAESMKH